MGSIGRIIPDWKTFLSQLKQTIQEKEQENQESQSHSLGTSIDEEQEAPLYLDASPSIQFHYTCAPNHLHCLTTFSGCSGTVVVGFQLGHMLLRHKMDMWADDGQGQLRHYLSIPMEKKYRVEHLVFVPTQRVLVGACSDLSLRVYTDTTQEMTVFHRATCPASVVCMHFCPETNELLTGSMGLIAFWGFWTSPQTPLGLVRVLDWNCCSLRRDTLVGALVTERQTSSIYALCNRHIKSFEHMGQQELLPFRGCSRATLRCITTDWLQRYLYTGDAAGYVQTWSRDIGGLLHEFRAHAQPISSVLLRPDTCSLLTASVGGWVKEWSRGGDLLFKLYVDSPGGVRGMSLMGQNCILCQSPSTLAVWRLHGLYRLFNNTGCGLKVMKRVESGLNRARLLVVTQDGVARLLSPGNGELLVLSWPFLHLDKALGFAYNPSQEELFVAYGAPEVIVLDTSLSPCPVKHLICTSKDHSDGVMCVEALQAEGIGWAGTQAPLCLVFSGHRSGKLQLLSPCGLHCQVQQAHMGTIIQTSSLPGPTPLICCYATDHQFSVWSVRVGVGRVELTLNTKVNCPATPVLSCLLPGLVCVISPSHSLLFFSLTRVECVERERSHAEPVSCLDYCPQLGLLALSGPGGNVEIWDCHGNMISEIRLGSAVSQVCFANARGDILACFSGSISLISSLHFLPVRLLRTVLEQATADDALEDPVPFLPSSPDSYNIALVPMISPGSKGNMPESIPPVVITVSETPEQQPPQTERRTRSVVQHYSLTPGKGALQVVKWSAPVRGVVWEDIVECEPVPEVDVWEEAKHQFQSSEKGLDVLEWPVAPDGFLPNSVIRGKGQKVEESIPTKTEPKGLQRKFPEEDVLQQTADISHILSTAKAVRCTMPPKNHLPVLQPEEEVQSISDIDCLKRIIIPILNQLEQADKHSYEEYSAALLEVVRSHSHTLNSEIIQLIKVLLLSQVGGQEPSWRQLGSWKNLEALELLQDTDLVMLGVPLTDTDPELRHMARTILEKTFKITNKTTLKGKLKQICLGLPVKSHSEGLGNQTSPQRESRLVGETTINPTISNKYLMQLLKILTEDLELVVQRKPEPKKTKKAECPQLTQTRRMTITEMLPPVMSVKKQEDQVIIPELTVSSTSRESVRRASLLPVEVKDKRKASLFPPVFPPPHASAPKQCVKNRPFKPLARQKVVEVVEKQEALVFNDPLLYIYRKSRRFTAALSSPAAGPGAKTDPLQIQASDSGLGSLLSQVSSSLQAPFVHAPHPVPEYCCLQPSRDEVVANWRESLHKLVSLYGFRSQKASKAAPPYSAFCPGPPAPLSVTEPQAKSMAHSLPQLPSRPLGQCALGERVVHMTQVRRKTWERPSSQFQHELPLPWQLSSYTLCSRGQSRYGRLELDWARSPEGALSDAHTLARPPLSPACQRLALS